MLIIGIKKKQSQRQQSGCQFKKSETLKITVISELSQILVNDSKELINEECASKNRKHPLRRMRASKKEKWSNYRSFLGCFKNNVNIKKGRVQYFFKKQ